MSPGGWGLAVLAMGAAAIFAAAPRAAGPAPEPIASSVLQIRGQLCRPRCGRSVAVTRSAKPVTPTRSRPASPTYARAAAMPRAAPSLLGRPQRIESLVSTKMWIETSSSPR